MRLRWSVRRLLHGVRWRARRLIPTSPDVGTPPRPTDGRRLRRRIQALQQQRAEDRRNALEYSFAYRQLAAAADGLGAWRLGPSDVTAPSRDEALEVRRQILALRRRATREASGPNIAAGSRDPETDDGDAAAGVDAATEAAWLLRWLDVVEQPPSAIDVAPGSVPIAVLDYKLPDIRMTSRNLGDYVQTLASLGHLARRRNLTLSGPPALAELARRLQQRVSDDRRLDGPPADVTLVPVDRDASNLGAMPDGTWAVAFGWYMHPYMASRLDFPFHPGLRPTPGCWCSTSIACAPTGSYDTTSRSSSATG